MRLIRFLILFPFFLFPHADDMYLLKGGNVFLPDVGFVKKDILVDEGLIISIERPALPTSPARRSTRRRTCRRTSRRPSPPPSPPR